ncbi:MAG: UDP-2,3-diacylglucosamine diphosphatase [Rhizobacter sp.]
MSAEVHAAPGWRCIDFISDLHLAADTPRTFDAWANYLRNTPADAVFILGDLFEVWVGDDARFDGFDARCAEVLTEVARQRSISFMVGNRDFLVGAEMLKDCGVSALPDPCALNAFGHRVLLTHGDALCLADTEYQKFRAMVRSADWQAEFLAKPLEDRRRFARDVRSQSEMRKQSHLSPADWADIDPTTAVDWLHRANTQTLIHGHTHRPATEPLGAGCIRHVLSDWDLDREPYRAEVLRLSAAGLKRLPLHAALK